MEVLKTLENDFKSLLIKEKLKEQKEEPSVALSLMQYSKQELDLIVMEKIGFSVADFHYKPLLREGKTLSQIVMRDFRV